MSCCQNTDITCRTIKIQYTMPEYRQNIDIGSGYDACMVIWKTYVCRQRDRQKQRERVARERDRETEREREREREAERERQTCQAHPQAHLEGVVYG